MRRSRVALRRAMAPAGRPTRRAVGTGPGGPSPRARRRTGSRPPRPPTGPVPDLGRSHPGVLVELAGGRSAALTLKGGQPVAVAAHVPRRPALVTLAAGGGGEKHGRRHDRQPALHDTSGGRRSQRHGGDSRAVGTQQDGCGPQRETLHNRPGQRAGRPAREPPADVRAEEHPQHTLPHDHPGGHGHHRRQLAAEKRPQAHPSHAEQSGHGEGAGHGVTDVPGEEVHRRAVGQGVGHGGEEGGRHHGQGHGDSGQRDGGELGPTTRRPPWGRRPPCPAVKNARTIPRGTPPSGPPAPPRRPAGSGGGRPG